MPKFKSSNCYILQGKLCIQYYCNFIWGTAWYSSTIFPSLVTLPYFSRIK